MLGVFRIPSSHRRVPVPGRPIGFRVPTVREVKEKVLKRPTVSKERALSYPSDGIVRAAASDAAQDRTLWKSDRIQRFDRVSLLYCRLMLGYRDRTVREEFVYLELKRKIEMRKADKQSVARDALPSIVRLIIGELEADIMCVALRGRRLSKCTSKGDPVVMGTFGRRTGQKVFLILDGGPDSSLFVKSVQTAAEFARTEQRRFKRRARTAFRYNHLACARTVH